MTVQQILIGRAVDLVHGINQVLLILVNIRNELAFGESGSLSFADQLACRIIVNADFGFGLFAKE
jgi:hypothetical protein